MIQNHYFFLHCPKQEAFVTFKNWLKFQNSFYLNQLLFINNLKQIISSTEYFDIESNTHMLMLTVIVFLIGLGPIGLFINLRLSARQFVKSE